MTSNSKNDRQENPQDISANFVNKKAEKWGNYSGDDVDDGIDSIGLARRKIKFSLEENSEIKKLLIF